MNKVGICLTVAFLLLIFASCATNSAGTSSARAAYGTPEPFRSHVKKNKKAKRKAQKAGKRKRALDPKQPYRRLPM